MSWIAWKKVCSNSRCGGLGIGSLLATNFAMLSKWWWRFHTDTNSLWRSVIISIHGNRGGFDFNDNSLMRLPPGPWKTILGINKPLLSANVDLNSIFSKRNGNGSSTIFWNNVLFGTTDLKSLFPRLHALETDKGCLVSARCTLLSGVVHFMWAWRRPIREGVEREQLNNLLGLLQHFSPTNFPDT
ncbi:reverse transcriptase domain, Reverse transcriptase zinc-binding domain protein [Artemisia annua]|uniref:Reverse transcriptase domain, Reverse transcriptase zinc-binding domain protein n=1 Tax=Artemisia annua TaxID=35608 RepID=A0A2U1NTX4_ARTAN|nr:reverse transcriptase domain, Reverse transcriptase zinc-binding domain protein [Artemisia annua]